MNTFIEAVAEASPAAVSNLAIGDTANGTGIEPAVLTTNSSAAPSGFFTADDITKAREQEKQKLYPQLERVKDELAALRKEKEEREALEAKAREEAAAEAKRRAEDEMDIRTLLQNKEQEWAAQLEAERQERLQAMALLDRERQFQEFQAYRSSRVEAEREAIIPELLDLVVGDTPEEIESSIASLKERSARILESAQQAMTSARRDMAGTRVTTPAAGPLDTDPGQKSFTADDIKSMSMSDYQKYRDRLIGGTANGRGRGLFG